MIGNFVGGDFLLSNSENLARVTNPATGEELDQVVLSTAEETAQAIEVAHQAFQTWSKVTPLNRSRILFRFKALVEENLDTLATLITVEHGKVFSDAKGELIRGLEVVEFACGIPHLQKGEHSRDVGSRIDSHSMMMPLGVCAGITPFNFPAMVPMWMFPLALATGNTFVLKPSEKNPTLSLKLAQLLQQAGLPEGVFNVVQGDKESVDEILFHPLVQAVSFVGSTPIAEYVYSTGSHYGKRVQALGGAKNHMVIMPDADLDQVTNALMGAAYGSAGERCMAISVAVVVGDETADQVVNKLSAALDKLNVGPGYDEQPENDMGPLVTGEHRDRVASYIQSGVEEGAHLIIDGRDHPLAYTSNGFFLGGTLFDQVTSDMKIYKEEIFGPVLCVVRVSSLQEAIDLVNAHEFGNGTSIFTRDGACSREYTDQIQVGMVGVNIPIPVPMAFHCFGGWKRSLFGPLHMHGPDGVRFFTRMKTVTTRWPDAGRVAADFVMPTMK
ncbi:methylmalonate-semialdehyde dehydrogenase (acylating) [Hahella sp. CCB-MM4]|uniref:CoA-acylating methylmalonate-semialdehyde dehydrogenase n=1 Tax=Hahella sp. (strain CCB-MM4) TaxID=1926491 RepID=UPI000B9C036E|nr:CoA-acylating methylmalonate-semialdehyde dehydrogenase [Hahella sp. CCB-MM4]OZG70392.1 methylmalonate-semialdehyde dehydrogenase (acylating) [Hahella sp. CCB-MM4]